MTRVVVWTLVLAGALWAAPAPAAEVDGVRVEEETLSQGVRSGRLSKDDLVRRAESLWFWEKLRLYYYAQALAPYFEGVEDSFRDLARVPAQDDEAVALARGRVAMAMEVALGRLLKSGREEPLADWRRGLTGLIFLDHDWRGRVYEQGKDEIKNPYDLVALVDCLDARLRGLSSQSVEECPARAQPTTSPEEASHATTTPARP